MIRIGSDFLWQGDSLGYDANDLSLELEEISLVYVGMGLVWNLFPWEEWSPVGWREWM